MTASVETAFAPSDPQAGVAGIGGDDDATAPRNRDSDDDVAVPRDRGSGDDMSRVLVAIEDRIDVLEREIATVGPLVLERERLLLARSAILGEPLPAHGTASAVGRARRVTRSNVAAPLRSHPGSKAGEIARQLEVGQPAVSAHLYRGKGSVFERRGDRWYLAGEK